MIASVIIPTHNRREGLTQLLDDLAAQDLDSEQFEVIIVNSPEGEDISDIVNSYAFRGRLVRHITTKNVVAAKRNAGAWQAKGELLIFLDDDVRVPSSCVSRHVATHDQTPTLLSGQIVFPGEWVSQRNYYRYKNSRHLNADNGMTFEKVISPHHVVSMNCSISSVAFRQSNGFNENFIHYGAEDIEFGFRCSRLGYRLLYSPGPLGIHQEVQGNVSTFARQIYIASLRGTDLLFSLAPEAVEVQTFRWTEPGVAANCHDRAVYQAVNSVSSHWLLHQLLRALEKTDRMRWLYMPIAYKAVTLMATHLGAVDRRAGRDRRKAFGFGEQYPRKEPQDETSICP